MLKPAPSALSSHPHYKLSSFKASKNLNKFYRFFCVLHMTA